jgi:spermidine synthase
LKSRGTPREAQIIGYDYFRPSGHSYGTSNLCEPRPTKVLMIGFGGGSLAKYCHRHLLTTQVTVVEIDPEVIALRTHF